MMSGLWPLLVIPVQIRVTDQPAYLLHRRDWQNTSLILDLITLDYGRVSLIAKGAKSGKSTGLLQPYCKLSVNWSGRQALKTLTSIDGSKLPIDEQLFLPLLYVNELVMAFLPPHESSPELFILYENLLKSIELSTIEPSLRVFERFAMQALGYLPDMTTEANSNQLIEAGRYYSFLASNGFDYCVETSVNAIKGQHILAWNQHEFEDPTVRRVAKQIMRRIIDFNLQGKRLKSRDIYLQMKQWQ